MLHDAILIPLSLSPEPLRLELPQQPTSTPIAPSATQTGGTAPAGAPTAAGGAGTQQPAGGAAPATGPMGSCGTEQLLMMGLFLALMWLLVLGPERKRKKETMAMMSTLKAGDRVITIGGMHGVVAEVTDKTVTLRCDQNKFVFDRSAIARVERGDASTPATKA